MLHDHLLWCILSCIKTFQSKMCTHLPQKWRSMQLQICRQKSWFTPRAADSQNGPLQCFFVKQPIQRFLYFHHRKHMPCLREIEMLFTYSSIEICWTHLIQMGVANTPVFIYIMTSLLRLWLCELFPQEFILRGRASLPMACQGLTQSGLEGDTK